MGKTRKGGGLSCFIKRGQVWRSKSSGAVIVIVSPKGGNGHWNTRKLGGGKSHAIHSGTLQKHYELKDTQ